MLRTCFLLLLILWNTCYVSARQTEERIVSGVLNDDEGFPLPGASIVIKGTTTGTITDFNGQYSLQAPLGATLVISAVGFTTYEIEVSTKNSRPLHQTPAVERPQQSLAIQKLYSVDDTQRGVARMGNEAPTYVLKSMGKRTATLYNNRLPSLRNVYSIRYLPPILATLKYGALGKNGLYVIDDRDYWYKSLEISVGSAFTMEQVNKLPELQSTYAQGRPVAGNEAWRGPETGEIFSWGPRMANLEYSDNSYPYDQNGPLTSRGNGNGQSAKVYNPYNYFQTGFSSNYHLNLKKQTDRANIQAGYQHKDQQSIFPGAGSSHNSFNFKANTRILSKLNTDYSLYLSNTENQLPERGANLAGIMSGIMLTPPSFDNSNKAGKKALNNEASYLLPDGSPRSYGPGYSDNPYGLSSLLRDRENLRTLLTTLNNSYTINNLSLRQGLSLDKQWNRSEFGLPLFATGTTEGRYTNRALEHTAFNYKINADNTSYLDDFRIYAAVNYNINYLQQNLRRKDGFGTGRNQEISLADSIVSTAFSPTRISHEVSASVKAVYLNALEAFISNRTYHSSTLPKGVILLPGASLGLILTELDPFSYSDVLSNAKVFASYSKSLKEAPLIYSNWQYNTTHLASADYLHYFENNELIQSKNLSPEIHHKQEYGTEVSLFHRLSLNVNYYNNLVKDAVLPVPASEGFYLSNGATVQTKGIDASISYNTHNNYYATGRLHWSSKLNFSLFRPVVKEVYGPHESIALAGFTDVSTRLVRGKAYGLIYGTTYKRNETGQRIIGADGYPLVDEALKPLGNPNPDWLGSFYNKLSLNRLSLAFTMEVKKGGDIWNGTSNVLNYHGASQATEEARNTRNYIFEGVREDGAVNTQVVDFANPANGLEKNRWVRYGKTGVAEDAIEDGSWIRLSNITLGYKINTFTKRIPRSETILSFTGRNLLLLTPYSGVDPSSTLFGYSGGTGLDLFNAPNTRSYTLSINIKL